MRTQDIPLWTAIAFAGGLAACQGTSAKSVLDGGADASIVETGAGDVAAVVDAAEGEPDAAADTAVPALPPPATIVQTSPEPWGLNCPRGGVKLQTALDRNGDRVINGSDETLGEQYVCNVYPEGVSLGARHSCVRVSNSAIWCWGADDAGQLGDHGLYAAYAPRPVAGVANTLALASGGDFACVILPTTGVRCWGKNDRGQGGHESDSALISPSCVTNDGINMLGATSLAAGPAHACAVVDGAVQCWGANQAGQLGDGTTVDHNHPVPVRGISGVRSVIAGGRHTCALLDDTTVRCWGANDEGQLGNGTTAAAPVSNSDGNAPLSGVKALAAGDAFTCAVMQDATVVCWGANADCQLGRANTSARGLLPVAAPVRDVQSLVAGSRHACAVLSSGKAVCWGRNDMGQVGAPAGDCRADPVTLPLAHVLSIGAGGSHSCAVDEIGIWCWGDNSAGQLGIGIASAARSTPEPQPAIWHLAP
jgi:alpha-tubulin suppressor-like RCC1 family protein